MNIVIIGTGNTANVLGRKLRQAGHHIVQVFGRDSAAASELAYNLGTESTNYWNVINRDADLYLLTVSDLAIEDVVKELNLGDKTLVHTAAAVPLDILQPASSHYGVFYPLQSLRKTTGHLPDTPMLVDASDPATLEQIEYLAQSITDRITVAGDEARLKMHLAAVFCNNFVNHLYTLTEQYCHDEGLDFSLLLPLIRETANRMGFQPAASLQTGPAVRGDQATIDRHLELLNQHPDMLAFYELFTDSIRRTGRS